MFSNKPKEIEIMGLPASEFFADIYTMSVENHFNGMIDFFNDFMSNASTIESEPIGSVGSIAFTKMAVEKCVQEIFKYYYFIFNEYIFPKIQNYYEIDYTLFKTNFSIGVYERIDGSNNFREFLYENWDLEDADFSVYEDDMLDDDKSIPQFYKEILPYYNSEKIGSLAELKIVRPYIQSSDLITIKQPNSIIENGMIYFFSTVLLQLHSLPNEPDPHEYWEDMKKYSPNIPYKEYFPKQFNSHYFDQLFNLMVDQTYTQTFSIQATGETTL
jgi:hypothetical protein|tara:strand:- start:104 stop:919 length:816 start_codon:yes stop_codon:yes gene_type:complete